MHLNSDAISDARRFGVEVGDVLVAVNGDALAFMTYDEVLERIRTAPRPLVLRFAKPGRGPLVQRRKRACCRRPNSAAGMTRTRVFQSRSSSRCRRRRRSRRRRNRGLSCNPRQAACPANSPRCAADMSLPASHQPARAAYSVDVAAGARPRGGSLSGEGGNDTRQQNGVLVATVGAGNGALPSHWGQGSSGRAMQRVTRTCARVAARARTATPDSAPRHQGKTGRFEGSW